MCELFGICAKRPYAANDMLDSFYHHSGLHRDGWGLAVFSGGAVSFEKEPVCAAGSSYLKRRLGSKIEARNLIAHIRRATLGRIEYDNCHPFIQADANGRVWTLAHNGTLFEGDLVSAFKEMQTGSTDSERILFYLISLVNDFTEKNNRAPDEDERFGLLEGLIAKLSAGNKLNLLIFDGEIMYVHTNCPGTLYTLCDGEALLFASSPVRKGGWESVPMNTLLSCKTGEPRKRGIPHSNDFYDEEHDYSSLFAAFSEL